MKLGLVVGIRPEVIKMAPLIKQCELKKLDYSVIHTGQHYSEKMDKKIFDDLDLPVPKYSLDVRSGSQAKQTARMISRTEDVLLQDRPGVLLVYGDSNSAMGPAIAAAKLNIPVGHVEAGLRSFDRTMPEEINRIIVDHLSDYLFAPTEVSKNQLLKEGISSKKVFVTGNTVVDSINYIKKIAKEKSTILKQIKLERNSYLLLTLHRPGNVDNKTRLFSVLKGMAELNRKYDIPIIFPIHPRTAKNLKKFNIEIPSEIFSIDPLGYIDFLHLQNNAKVVFTDSGSMQEETCILKIPCVTLRDNTERPESVVGGSNVLCKPNFESINEAYNFQIKNNRNWINPYGDGHAAEKILDAIINN